VRPTLGQGISFRSVSFFCANKIEDPNYLCPCPDRSPLQSSGSLLPDFLPVFIVVPVTCSSHLPPVSQGLVHRDLIRILQV
jgi:hypothetical protein